MNKDVFIPLGFEVGTGRQISIPLGHLCVLGQTQQAGKTTALEALIHRAGVRAIAFVTKRGEGGFSNSRTILPYLQERADWQSVQSILESTLSDKQSFKQPWIIRACEGADTLADVQENTKRLLNNARRGMEQDMYYVLDHYFDLVIPQIRSLPKCDRIELAEGLNVMDLEGYSPELQAQVIRSTIEWVHSREKGVVTIIPEAWRFLPQGRRSPVRDAAQELVREGAGLRNFVWIDSQDIAGVDKLPLRAARDWLIGVQRETNEVKRNLDNIPASFAKPKAQEVSLLKLGQFFACFGHEVIKTYVQPAWMSDEDARRIAIGDLAVEDVSRPREIAKKPAKITPPPARISHKPEPLQKPPREDRAAKTIEPPNPDEDEMSKEDIIRIENSIKTMANSVGEMAGAVKSLVRAGAPIAREASASSAAPIWDEDALYERFKTRLIEESPAIIRTIALKPEISVKAKRVVIEADKSLKGRVALLISEGFFKEPRPSLDVAREFGCRGIGYANNTLGQALAALNSMGALIKEGNAFQQASGVKINK